MCEKKKITKLLFSINSLSAKGGGAEKILSTISKLLSSNNQYKIFILTFDKPNEKIFYDFPKKITIYKAGNYDFFSNKIFKNLLRILIFIYYLIKIKPNISFGFMHSNYINLSFASIFSKSKIVACEHIVPEHYFNKKLEFKLIYLSSLIFDKITVVSNQVKKLFPKFLKKKMTIINNVVTPIKKKNNLKIKKKNIILSIGRIEEQKNFLTLIYAFREFQKEKKDWHLKIIGDGSEKKKILRAIKHFKLQKKVKIYNFTKNLYPHYKSASIYVCSSIYESFGLTVAEAINFDLPVIGFKKCSGTNQLIKKHNKGFLIDTYHYDFKSLGKEMIYVSKMIEKNKIIKKNLIFKPEEEFNKKKVLKEWVNLINNLRFKNV
jgi:glycosyltransferase involved in cell wall biosynthesis